MGEVTDDVLNHFSKFDLNGDGLIDHTELSQVLKRLNGRLWTDAAVEKLLAQVDLNKDGKIELEEFVHWVFDTPMLQCICGFTCGTQKALDKHIARFKDQPEAHGLKTVLSRMEDLALTTVEETSPTVSPKPTDSPKPMGKTVSLPAEAMRSNGLDKSLSSNGLDKSLRSLSSASLSDPLSPESCKTPAPTPANHNRRDGPNVRMFIVRHAQSANKCRAEGQAAESDPGLTDLGHEQAAALAIRLKKDLRPQLIREHGVLVVSSPMRRCLLTILPTVQELGLPIEDCVCHGGAYEFGCAGTGFAGSTPAQIAKEFPEFRPECFSAAGTWDYRGSNEREDGQDMKERAARLASWLHNEAAEVLRGRELSARQIRTIFLVTHQTFADLLCQVMVDGTDEKWVYGEVHHRLQNAGITEVVLSTEGTATFGAKNDGSHLLDLRWRNKQAKGHAN